MAFTAKHFGYEIFILSPISSLFPTCILHVSIAWSTSPILLLGMLGPNPFSFLYVTFSGLDGFCGYNRIQILNIMTLKKIPGGKEWGCYGYLDHFTSTFAPWSSAVATIIIITDSVLAIWSLTRRSPGTVSWPECHDDTERHSFPDSISPVFNLRRPVPISSPGFIQTLKLSVHI